MPLDLRRALEPFARALQRAYARAIRQAPPRVPHPDARGPVGGSLVDEVLRPDLVTHTRAGVAFSPSRLGLRFRLWWRGTSRQRARGRDVPVDAARLARALEEDLARQVEAWDRRTP